MVANRNERGLICFLAKFVCQFISKPTAPGFGQLCFRQNLTNFLAVSGLFLASNYLSGSGLRFRVRS